MNYIEAVKRMSADPNCFMYNGSIQLWVYYRCHRGWLQWTNNKGKDWHNELAFVHLAEAEWHEVVAE